MNCDRIRKLVCDYIGDNLNPSLRREVEDHLAQCPGCRAEVQSTESMVSCLRSLSSQRSPVDCWPAIRERVVAQQRRRVSWGTWFARPAVAVPAFALALLLALFLIWPAQLHEAPGSVADAVPEYVQYISAHSRVQQQQALTDPDVTFIAAELETASLTTDSIRP